ncbi:MAG TPA: hypothetical protein PLY93_07610, partial [Turneriella sp.]|nr:hypothetical protein [Turneriella sp.]
GVLFLGGAIPFIETTAGAVDFPDSVLYLKSDALAHFLLKNRSLLKTYLAKAAARYTLVCDIPQTYIAHVTSEEAGMEAANFAVFLAAQFSVNIGKTLLVDADPQNQSLFSLLTFEEKPPVLTENIQTTVTFKSDMTKAILPLAKNFFYLNLQAPSLRPFNDDELCRIIPLLDGDFENIVIYAGKMESAWLSKNAHINYAICSKAYISEAAQLLRHQGGFHTVLLKKGSEAYLPNLNAQFAQKQSLATWIESDSKQTALRTFVLRLRTAKNLVMGRESDDTNTLHCHVGIDLFAHYTKGTIKSLEGALRQLQQKLTPQYPKKSFFRPASIEHALRNIPTRTSTTLLLLDDAPQLVSLVDSSKLKAAAILPAGVYPALSYQKMRIASCTAGGLTHFQEIIARGGFNSLQKAERLVLKNPSALGAILEQLQP